MSAKLNYDILYLADSVLQEILVFIARNLPKNAMFCSPNFSWDHWCLKATSFVFGGYSC